MSLEVKTFGTLQDGSEVKLYTLQNEKGMSMEVIPYGCRIVKLWVPDREGNMGDVVLGHDDLKEYTNEKDFLGAAIGRFANRIGNSSFVLDGKTYTLTNNEGPNTLHGGPTGFYARLWNVKETDSSDASPSITFAYTSPDGEEGYPGTLEATIQYTLTPDNELVIKYTAVTDKATPVNLTNHSYFNLSGDHSKTILEEELQVSADSYTVNGPGLIPAGETAPVAGTVYDFNTAKPIGRDMDIQDPLLKDTKGFDLNFCLKGEGLRKVAEVYDPSSGRCMSVSTDLPGMQFYSGNFMGGCAKGKNGVTHPDYSAFCLETQLYPNTPNCPNFPNCIVRPGEVFESTTIYGFSVR